MGSLPGRSPQGLWDEPLTLALHQTWRGLHPGTGTGKTTFLILSRLYWRKGGRKSHPIKIQSMKLLPTLCVSTVQDTLGGRFDAAQSYVGEMSDLNMWSHVLSSSDIYSLASCSSHLRGDVITWSETEVELHGGVARYPFDLCH